MKAYKAQKRGRAETDRRRVLAGIGIPHDPRTAAGVRELHVQEIRGGEKRVSTLDPGQLIKRQSERTEARIRAIAAFDSLCHDVYAGLYPSPKFERGVDVSHTPGRPLARSSAASEMQQLARRIGDEAQAILHLRIFERHSFAWMAQQGLGNPEHLGVLFLSAVDAVARFYGFAGPSPAQRIVERKLQAV